MKKHVLFLVIFMMMVSQCGQSGVSSYHLANRYYAFDLYDSAINEYTNALSSSIPEEVKPECLFMIGECHRKQGNIDNAINTYRDYLRKYPGSELEWKCNLMLGRLLPLQNPFEKTASLQYYRNALTGISGNATRSAIILEMAELLLKDREYNQVRELLSGISADTLTNPWQVRYHNILGTIFLDADQDYVKSLEQFKKSQELISPGVTAMDTLLGMAECYRKLGMLDKSRETLLQVVQNPVSSHAYAAEVILNNLESEQTDKSKSLARLQDSFDQLASSSLPDIREQEEMLRIEADSTIYSGHVSVLRKDVQLDAHQVTYDQNKQQIIAENVTLSLPDKLMKISAESAVYNLADGTVSLRGTPQVSVENGPFTPVEHIGVNLQTGDVQIVSMTQE